MLKLYKFKKVCFQNIFIYHHDGPLLPSSVSVMLLQLQTSTSDSP